MIAYRDDHDIDLDALAVLRAACAFAAKDRAFLAGQLAGSRWVAHAYDGTRLVGFARAISDGVSSAYLSSVMVDPSYRRRGIGRALIERIIGGRDNIKFVLHARAEAVPFYAAVGFAPASDMMMRDRRR